MRGRVIDVKKSDAKYKKDDPLWLELVSGQKIKVKVISNEFKVEVATPVGLQPVHAYRLVEVETGKIRTLVPETELTSK